MKTPRIRSVVVAVSLALGVVACGHKGPPLPPLRPVPAAVSDFSIERRGAVVTLRFTVPESNADGSTPPAVERVDVFAVSTSADAQSPTPAEVLLPANLVTAVYIRSLEPALPGTPPDLRPAPGEVATFVDAVAGANDAVPAVRYYAVVPAAGRRRGPLGPILRVPLSEAPAAPIGLRADYTERTLSLAWQPAAAGQRFVIEQTDERGAAATRLSTSLLDAPPFEVPVQFGQARCFVVRAVDSLDAVSILGAPSAPTCVTPRDRFPPPAPTDLLAVAGASGVELVWTAVSAPDLGGYVVLRGDGANGTLQGLTPALIAATAYRDQSARSGATYVYAVIAVDTATPPNVSERSNLQVVTARQARPGAGGER